MLIRQLSRVNRYLFCTKVQNSQSSFEEQLSAKFLQNNLDLLKIKFNVTQTNELIQQLTKPLHEIEDKTKYIFNLSQIILENKDQLKQHRYETNQIIRKYLSNKWPCAENFESQMIDFAIQEFQNNYKEIDEGHNLLQFFRVVVLSEKYTKQQIKKIAQLYNQHYLRINIKFAILSLYYAQQCNALDKFSILVKIIDELSIFIEFNSFSTLTLIMENLNDQQTFNMLKPIVIRIQQEFLQKETCLLNNILMTRFDALVEFLKLSNLMIPEFERYCEVQRIRLQNLQDKGINRHSMTSILTVDQEEVLSRIYDQYSSEKHTVENNNEDSSDDNFLDDLLIKHQKK
ncbi:hypothetical protein TTHERM_00777080 (macronuclear) [Tetrahymena thermophila SB210]|uniref:Uncharacterized protein n=1 Tax=Tetrahymena thermophila (strain SB210) TaxID=312017 RepID=Q23WU7_TETTS|nr:hypothetical protein TTHERM_00777080 [Tetrahymena thermophila SB210]EAS00998.1 hypothetical protein TTHERM_00777080 [Tetrahymena thermophila SB210]|eukprot:XP_001021243.1 hypothetical protein TTHERM_00777080 [Tetrahymena thermophila SB210]